MRVSTIIMLICAIHSYELESKLLKARCIKGNIGVRNHGLGFRACNASQYSSGGFSLYRRQNLGCGASPFALFWGPTFCRN